MIVQTSTNFWHVSTIWIHLKCSHGRFSELQPVRAFVPLLLRRCERAQSCQCNPLRGRGHGPGKYVMKTHQLVIDQWIRLREHLQETPSFLPSNIGFSCKISHHPILWIDSYCCSLRFVVALCCFTEPFESWDDMTRPVRWVAAHVPKLAHGQRRCPWRGWKKEPVGQVQRPFERTSRSIASGFAMSWLSSESGLRLKTMCCTVL